MNEVDAGARGVQAEVPGAGVPGAGVPGAGVPTPGALTLHATASAERGSIIGHWTLSGPAGVVAGGMISVGTQAGLSPPPVADWALFASLPSAVLLGGTLRLHGSASRRALSDAAELSRAWASFTEGGVAGLVLEADAVADHPPRAAPHRAVLVLPSDGDGHTSVPAGLTVVHKVYDGARPAGAAGTPSGLTLAAEAEPGPGPGYFTTMARRAAALHLLAGEARFGLFHIDAGMAPRPGGLSTPAHAAAFLSGGAVEVLPLIDHGERLRPRHELARPGLIVKHRPVTVDFAQHDRGGATRRELVLEGLADRRRGERVTMWWEMPGEAGMPVPPVLDQMVAAAVIPALERGQDLVVRGPISRLASVNLPLLAAARAAWGARAPRGPIAVIADSVLDLPPREGTPRAVVTFSGGADSFHSLLWRTGPDAPPTEPRLAAAVMTFGFDFPLDQREAFETHRARLAPVLERRGVAMHIVHTNSRGLGLAVWDNAAMPMIAAALSQFSHLYGRGLLGGSLPYPVMKVPMIQPPLLDRTLAGDWFWLATDGASVGRTEKIALVAANEDAMAALRVCFDETSRDFANNCCRCLKCERTMLNFIGAGILHPTCFATVPEPLTLAERTPFHKKTDLSFAEEVARYAAAHGTAGRWSERLLERAAAWRPEPPPPAKTRAEWVAEKLAIWGGRLVRDPLGTPALAVRKLAAKLDRMTR